MIALATSLQREGLRPLLLQIPMETQIGETGAKHLDLHHSITELDVDSMQVDVEMPWFRGMPITRPAMMLLEYLRARPYMCSQLHAIDRHGYSFYVAQAKRAGLDEFAALQVVTHVFNADILLSQQLAWGEYKKRRLNDVFRSAQERMAVENSDAVIFSSHAQRTRLASLWNLPQMSTVARKVRSTTQTTAFQTTKNITIVFSAEYIGERDGLTFLYQAIGSLPPQTISSISLAVVGDVMFEYAETFARILKAFEDAGVTRIALHSWRDALTLQLWSRLASHAIAVFPSWRDTENMALINAIASGMPVLTSDTAYHRELIAQADHAMTMFKLRPEAISQALSGMLEQSARKSIAQANMYSVTLASRFSIDLLSNRLIHKPARLEPVTVIIPFCGRSEYLNSSIRSVYNQTVRNVRTHVLLVAACPTQLPCKVVEYNPVLTGLNFECVDNRQEDGSLGGARNIGLKHSKTDLNYFLDDDDELDGRGLADVLTAAALNPGVSHFPSFADIFYDDGASQKQLGARWSLIGPAPEVALVVNAVGFANALIRRSNLAFTQENGYTSDLSLGAGCEDWEISALAVFARKSMLVPARTYWYRKRVTKDGKLKGMLATLGADELQVTLCRVRVLDGVSRQANIAWSFPLAQYAQALYESFDPTKW
jgi:glycosyltransferase involved in cell wall biosynthesis